MFDDIRVLGNKMKDVFTMLRRTVSVATVSQVDSELRRVKVTFAGGRIPESDWSPPDSTTIPLKILNTAA